MKKKYTVRIEDLSRGETSTHIFDTEAEAKAFVLDSWADYIQREGEIEEWQEEWAEAVARGDYNAAEDAFDTYGIDQDLMERYSIEEAWQR